MSSLRRRCRLFAPWLPLALPLLALSILAITDPRAGWRQLRVGEATPLMQAESLWRDGDLRYERLDFERHVVTRHGPPRDLALASGTNGRILTFDASIVPALVMTPGLLVRGELGFQAANACLLVLVAVAAALLVAGRLGRLAPIWLSVLIFGTTAFGYVFHATADLTLFALVLLAAALVAGPGAGASSPRRWALAGALLSVAVFGHWQHILLLLPFAAAAPADGKRLPARAGWVAGLALGLMVQACVLWLAGGGLGAFDTVRFVFTPETGFPLVDLPFEDWAYSVSQLSALHFTGAPRLSWGLEPALVAWNAVYLLVGESIGVLTYGAAPLLLLALGRRRAPFRAWLLGVMLWALATVLLSPFDLYGGQGAIGNRLFLPWLAVLVLIWDRPPRRRRPRLAAGLTVLAAMALAAPFLFELWRSPAGPPVVESSAGTVYRHASPLARSWLPYELSQQPLPGGPVLDHAGLRVRLLDADLGEARRDVLLLDGAETATLWLASPHRLESVDLAFGASAPAEITVFGGRLIDRVLRPDGGIVFRLEVPSRRHGMWWSPRPQWVYRLSFRLPSAPEGSLEFRVVGDPADLGGM